MSRGGSRQSNSQNTDNICLLRESQRGMGWGTSRARQGKQPSSNYTRGSSAVINSPRTPSQVRPGRLVPSILKTVTREADIKTPSECSPLLAAFRETRRRGGVSERVERILIDGTRPFLSIPNSPTEELARRNPWRSFSTWRRNSLRKATLVMHNQSDRLCRPTDTEEVLSKDFLAWKKFRGAEGVRSSHGGMKIGGRWFRESWDSILNKIAKYLSIS